MMSELRELSAAVLYTVEGVGPCKRIHVGRGLSEDQCDQLLTWMRRYPGLIPDAEAIVLLPNVMKPQNPLTFTLSPVHGLDRVWVLFVSDAWWRTNREEREREFVQHLLLFSLAYSGLLIWGPEGRPLLLDDGGDEHRDHNIERWLEMRTRALLRYARR